MKIITVCVIGLGIVLSGCSSQSTPANNDIQYVPPIPAVSPVPETEATLVPNPNRSANVGGSVGIEGK